MKPCGALIVAILALFAFALSGEASATSGETFEPVKASVNLYGHYAAYSGHPLKSPDDVAKQNLDVFNSLNAWQPSSVPGRTDAIDLASATSILNDAMKDDVIQLAKLPTYDPGGNIVFCFGRAMWLHLELVKRGVNKASVFKAFLVGKMFEGGIFWQFHVATIVKSTDGGFFVLDPLMGKVMTLEDWFHMHMDQSVDRKLRLYITEATKFAPSAGKYAKRSLEDPFYNSFLTDVLAGFRARSKSAHLRNGHANLNRVAPTCGDLFSESI